MGLDFFNTQSNLVCVHVKVSFWDGSVLIYLGTNKECSLQPFSAIGMKQHFFIIHHFGHFSNCNISKAIPVCWTDWS